MVNPTRRKGAGIDFVLPGSRPASAAAGDIAAPAGELSPAKPAADGGREGDVPGAVKGASGGTGGAAAESAAVPGPGARTLASNGATEALAGGEQAEGQGAPASSPLRSAPVAPVAPVQVGLGADRPRGRTGVGLLAETVFESQRLERRIAELNGRVEQLSAERGAQALDPRLIAPSRWANR